MTPVLTPSQRQATLKGIMKPTGFSSNLDDMKNAFKKAADKFNLKIKVSAKGTEQERWTLSTNWDNCNEVADYISSLKCYTGTINDKVTFAVHNFQ